MVGFLKYLPVIRHVRWVYQAHKVSQDYAEWNLKVGCLPSSVEADYQRLDRVWAGLE